MVDPNSLTFCFSLWSVQITYICHHFQLEFISNMKISSIISIQFCLIVVLMNNLVTWYRLIFISGNACASLLMWYHLVERMVTCAINEKSDSNSQEVQKRWLVWMYSAWAQPECSFACSVLCPSIFKCFLGDFCCYIYPT